VDCDVLLRADIADLFALADPKMAVQCVQHRQEDGALTKMDGQVQTFYARKNWSSVMLFNLRHPALKVLTEAKLNTWTGRALHGFNWLADQFIGALPPEWNHLVGVEPETPMPSWSTSRSASRRCPDTRSSSTPTSGGITARRWSSAARPSPADRPDHRERPNARRRRAPGA
jgi:hypothetical protein